MHPPSPAALHLTGREAGCSIVGCKLANVRAYRQKKSASSVKKEEALNNS